MQGIFRAAADAKRIEEPWGSLTWLASKGLTGCAGMTVGRVVIKRGQCNPRHAHRTCQEVLYLLRGELRHSVGSESVVLRAGDTLVVPAGVFHNAASIGEEDADMMVTYDSGERDFVREAQGA